ncbi:hypothetical protein J4477_02380 [Candidatus Pacearchaeota archaeon]|nr:hypothetical protein [Candidatus Pacearchaeota archaeon]
MEVINSLDVGTRISEVEWIVESEPPVITTLRRCEDGSILKTGYILSKNETDSDTNLLNFGDTRYRKDDPRKREEYQSLNYTLTQFESNAREGSI